MISWEDVLKIDLVLQALSWHCWGNEKALFLSPFKWVLSQFSFLYLSMIVRVSYGLSWERLDARDRMGKYRYLAWLRCMIFTSINIFRFGGSNDFDLSISLLCSLIWRFGGQVKLRSAIDIGGAKEMGTGDQMGLLDTKSCGCKKALDHIDSSQMEKHVYGTTPSVSCSLCYRSCFIALTARHQRGGFMHNS